LITFDPPRAEQELVFSAHYDSKTELLDHRQRLFFLKNLRVGIVLTLILGMFGPLDSWLVVQGSPLEPGFYWTGVVLTFPLLFLAFGLGLNLATGRLLAPSQGAVDNGAGCAILLGLANKLAHGELDLKRTKVTLCLFTGEEVNMQGSRAYVRQRDWPYPSIAVNLEVMAQDGDYVFWEQDGNAFNLSPTDARINDSLIQAVARITGCRALPAGPVNSDGASFLATGIPAGTLGTYDRHLLDTGFHRPSDNLSRVIMERLPEGVEILSSFLLQYEASMENSRLNR
jgi:hypothetical protein